MCSDIEAIRVPFEAPTAAFGAREGQGGGRRVEVDSLGCRLTLSARYTRRSEGMTYPTWRERKQELLRLLAELSLEVYAPATTRDEKLHRALLQPDQAGSRPPSEPRSPSG